MTRHTNRFLCPLAIVGILMMGCASKRPLVLLIARETSDNMTLMIEKEVKPIIQKLTEAGYAVTVASESGTKLKTENAQLEVNKKLSNVTVKDYVGVVVPCMAAGGTEKEIPQSAVQIVADAGKAGLPLAAQQSGVRILGLAGVLTGKDYAIAEGPENLIPGANYKGMGVVRDGMVVTSGTCPFMAAEYGMKDGTEELVTSFISILKK
jgi:putative intracellular protease/amidase